MSNNLPDCATGYFTRGMVTVDGAQMGNASRTPVDTAQAGGESPQSGGIIPGTLPLFNNAITAHVGGTKAAAFQLGYGANRISVCGTATNSVLLPYAFAGAVAFLSNDGAQSTTVFGAGTDTIDAVATATGNPMAAAKRTFFIGLSGSGDGSDTGTWVSCAGAKIT